MAATPDDEGSAAWRELFQGGHLWVTAILCLGLWLNAADALVVSTIMPTVAKDVGGYAYFAWATAGFMLGSILAGATAGLLATRVGLRPGLAGSAILYAAGCAGSALAGTIAPFLFGRVVQGAGAGFIIGLCYVAVRAAYHERLWPLVFATLSGVWGVATLFGPLIGGALAGAHLWRVVFWLFAAQALLFAGAVKALPKRADPDEAASPGVPVRQLLALTAGVALTAIAAVVKVVAVAALATVGGLLLLALAFKLDRGATTRLLPKSARRLSSPSARGYAAVLTLATSAASFSVYAVALLQARLHLDPLYAGYVAASESVGWTVLALLAARLPPSFRPAMIRIGPALIALGLGGCAFAFSDAGVGPILLSGLVMGGGFGLCWSFISQAVLADLPEDEASLGSAALPTMQLLGNALGAAAAGVLAQLLGLSTGFSAAAAARAAPVLLGAFIPLALVGLAAAWNLGVQPRAGGRGHP